MNNILITGGAGFIGSALANYYCKNHNIIVVDDLSMGNEKNLIKSKNITLIKGSVTDQQLMAQLLETQQFDYIFHLAAIASVADSVQRPLETHHVNFDSVLYLLELVKKQTGLKRLLFTSSAAVYGDEPTLPKQEESVIRPLTPYAIDKFSAEKYVVDYCHLYGVPTSAVRFFNVYGPNQNPNSPYSGVISIIMDCYKQLLKNNNTSFTMFGDGNQSRDFIYIDDVIKALDLIVSSDEALAEVYNVGTGNSVTLNNLISIIGESLNKDLSINYENERDGDIRESLADISKIKSIGFQPEFDIKKGLRKYIKHELNLD
ncbi:NAD-dependent epimerase/dehydratase [Enterococcus haemoperoxidus ATCC BAA-382]|uniref:NAD-dependent epimerase/dehydratase n=1 Tax=Enterococcus haemoperoxidus ATCC BAA-382 TaxID=1158608 RepID=R2QBY1_9ENTE|nr:NAD-dependent epimerase/dehydratase family protein [Enterococcus haemoperoxidus]EOH92753.1 NAD-dependent epimerase/dehydratase [Enterococcus haemoperoxidus ATCC BAA-382]EOT61496.1 NAD-dependent epimerase/dehydratase [Enterococcus haemoperoxidus ATCC BAA-382]